MNRLRKCMKMGKRGIPWRRLLLPALFGPLFLGCAANRSHVEKQLRTDQFFDRQKDQVGDYYLVACPDVLDLQFKHKPELSGRRLIGPDGRVDLGDYGKLRVEGHSLLDVANHLAKETGGAPNDVAVRVVAYRSQHILLFGQVIGWQRAVPYQGQETVLDLLQRVGGITPGAAPSDVHVVRTHLGEHQRPEVFHVNLEAIVLRHDERTNLRLLPDDQVYVGETRQAALERILPPWMRPLIQALCNTRP